jgi:hypothetical protein
MKRRSAFLSFTACALTAAAPLRATVTTAPTPVKTVAPAEVSGVEVVTYASGVTGIYDKSAGKMYLYDPATKKCVGVRRMTGEQGAAMELPEQVRSQMDFGNEGGESAKR